jgi:hypothetical protein
VTRLASWLTAIMAASLACGVAAPLGAQSANDQVRVVTTPDGKTVHVMPARPGKRPHVRSAVLPMVTPSMLSRSKQETAARYASGASMMSLQGLMVRLPRWPSVRST